MVFSRSGSVLKVQVNGLTALPAGAETVICTIPNGFVPANNQSYDAIGISANDSATNLRILRMRVETNGNFKIYNYGIELTNANLNLVGIFVA